MLKEDSRKLERLKRGDEIDNELESFLEHRLRNQTYFGLNWDTKPKNPENTTNKGGRPKKRRVFDDD